jgi:hypothetical protein
LTDERVFIPRELEGKSKDAGKRGFRERVSKVDGEERRERMAAKNMAANGRE